MTYFFQNEKGRTIYIDVSYFDALEGGSGLTRIKAEELFAWLESRPGVLIRKIKDVT